MEEFLIALEVIDIDADFKTRIRGLMHETDLDILREPITIELLKIIYGTINDTFANVEKLAYVLVILYAHCKTLLSDREYQLALRKFHSDIEPMFVFGENHDYDDAEILFTLGLQTHPLQQRNMWKKEEAIHEIQCILGYISGYYRYYDTVLETSLGNDLLLASIMFYQRLIGFGEPYVWVSFDKWRNR